MNKLLESIRSWWNYNQSGIGTPPFLLNSIPSATYGSPTNALAFTPLYRCVTLIASDVARVDAEFANPNVQRAFDRPNQYMNGFTWRREATISALLYGNSFTLINRNGRGDIYQLMPLPDGSVTLDTTGATPFYFHNEYGKIAMEDMIHLKAPMMTAGSLMAASPVNLCKTAIGIGISEMNSEMESYVNGMGKPTVAITFPQTMNAAGRVMIQNDYIKNHNAGNGNGAVPIVLAEGAKIETVKSVISDANIDAAKKFSIAEVSRIYGVPMSLLSETAGSVYGSLEFLQRIYMSTCLSYWFEEWATEIELKLGDKPEFDTDVITKPSFTETASGLRTLLEASLITRNEGREVLDLEPVEGGNEFIMPMNFATGTQNGGGKSNAGVDTSQGTSEGDN
jgi:HK97 family phage portal protein